MNISPPLWKQVATCFHAGILLGLFDPEDGGDTFLRNVLLTFNEPHGAISQKIVLFITNVVRTSNLKSHLLMRHNYHTRNRYFITGTASMV
jgi:hypothetical protein